MHHSAYNLKCLPPSGTCNNGVYVLGPKLMANNSYTFEIPCLSSSQKLSACLCNLQLGRLVQHFALPTRVNGIFDLIIKTSLTQVHNSINSILHGPGETEIVSAFLISLSGTPRPLPKQTTQLHENILSQLSVAKKGKFLPIVAFCNSRCQ